MAGDWEGILIMMRGTEAGERNRGQNQLPGPGLWEVSVQAHTYAQKKPWPENMWVCKSADNEMRKGMIFQEECGDVLLWEDEDQDVVKSTVPPSSIFKVSRHVGNSIS